MDRDFWPRHSGRQFTCAHPPVELQMSLWVVWNYCEEGMISPRTFAHKCFARSERVAADLLLHTKRKFGNRLIPDLHRHHEITTLCNAHISRVTDSRSKDCECWKPLELFEPERNTGHNLTARLGDHKCSRLITRRRKNHLQPLH